MDQSSVKWWRVVDPLNPLCGCDVRLGTDESDKTPCDYLKFARFEGQSFGSVTALRKLDVLVGDRPFQLVNREGDIGLMVDLAHLEPSPVQDDVVEIGYDLPHGKCLCEDTTSDGDGAEFRVVTYERAVQVAYGEAEGELYATSTLRGPDRDERLERLRALFNSKAFDHDSFIAVVKQENY